MQGRPRPSRATRRRCGSRPAIGTPVGQAVVRGEFRTEKDLVERIGGGAGPGGAKAVAPTGAEPDCRDAAGGRQRGAHRRRAAGGRAARRHRGGHRRRDARSRSSARSEIEYRPAPAPARQAASALRPAQTTCASWSPTTSRSRNTLLVRTLEQWGHRSRSVDDGLEACLRLIAPVAAVARDSRLGDARPGRASRSAGGSGPRRCACSRTS